MPEKFVSRTFVAIVFVDAIKIYLIVRSKKCMRNITRHTQDYDDINKIHHLSDYDVEHRVNSSRLCRTNQFCALSTVGHR
jgi:regulatory protein YycH of two-component signal transduction system YycFG